MYSTHIHVSLHTHIYIYTLNNTCIITHTYIYTYTIIHIYSFMYSTTTFKHLFLLPNPAEKVVPKLWGGPWLGEDGGDLLHQTGADVLRRVNRPAEFGGIGKSHRLPSGKHTKSYWKWWFIVDFPINSMVIFHCYVNVHQRVKPVENVTHGTTKLQWNRWFDDLLTC